MQSPISNEFPNVSIDGHYEPQLVSKLLLQVSVREIHNRVVIHPYEGVLKETRYAKNNIIISESKLRSILPPQLNNMYARYKVMCVCECCICAKIINSSLLSWHDCYLRKLNNLSKKKNRGSGENYNHLFETCKLCDDTWASYICNSIWRGHGYNMCISTIPTCIDPLEMCVALLF